MGYTSGFYGDNGNKTETTIMGYIGHRIWGIWGSYYTIPKAIFYLLKGDLYHGVSMGPIGFSV